MNEEQHPREPATVLASMLDVQDGSEEKSQVDQEEGGSDPDLSIRTHMGMQDASTTTEQDGDKVSSLEEHGHKTAVLVLPLVGTAARV